MKRKCRLLQIEVLPFAVVGSNDFVKVGNKMVRARQYPWGVGKIQKENSRNEI